MVGERQGWGRDSGYLFATVDRISVGLGVERRKVRARSAPSSLSYDGQAEGEVVLGLGRGFRGDGILWVGDDCKGRGRMAVCGKCSAS